MTSGPFDFSFCANLSQMEGGEQLLSAIACDKLDAVRAILQASPELVNFRGSVDPLKRTRSLSTFSMSRVAVTGLMPLHVAAASFASNRLEIFDLLVAMGGDLNAKDGQGATVLKWAMIAKNKPVVDRIFELNNTHPVWRGRIADASTGSQISRGIFKAPKKLVSGVGKTLSSGASFASSIAMEAISGGKKKNTRNTRKGRKERKERKERKSTRRATRKH